MFHFNRAAQQDKNHARFTLLHRPPQPESADVRTTGSHGIQRPGRNKNLQQPTKNQALFLAPPFAMPQRSSKIRLPAISESPDLGPLTEESLSALRNLASHVPTPEPCPNAIPAFRRAAVLLGIFGSRKGELYVILSQRSSGLRSHGGDTAIPGGRYEIGDADLEATARREAWEETGLPIDTRKAVRLCELKPFLSANELVVTPIVVLLIDPMIKVGRWRIRH